LTKAVEKIVIEDDSGKLRQRVTELKSEKRKLKAAAVEASEDYEVLQLVNVSLLDERNESRYKCEDLEAELKKVRSDSTATITALKSKVKSAETHSAKVAAASDRCLNDIETNLIKDLAGL
jgi:SMC interacting uncharacterized protein involved in chromosome segregation